MRAQGAEKVPRPGCDEVAVLFPRSPLCAGRPAFYGFYAPFAWDHYWSY
jgi:hypothetical protein